MKITKEIVALILLALVFEASIACYKYNISYLMWDWALADVGQTYMSAVHVLDGRIPYKDFDYQWGPYSLYLSAFLFKVFGIKISVMRLAMTLTVIAITFLTYLLGRQLLPVFLSFFAALIVHIIFIRNTTVPYANIFVVATGLGSLLLVVLHCRTRQNHLVLLAGLLCGISLGLKFSAGLFVIAGIICGLLLAGGNQERIKFDTSRLSLLSSLRILIPAILIINSIILFRAHLNAKYAALFLAPILFVCVAALQRKKNLNQAGEAVEREKSALGRGLPYLILGVLAGSAPWLVFYLTKLEKDKFFYYLIGAPLEHSEHIFHAYYAMEKMTKYLLLYSTCCWVAVCLLKKRLSGRFVWLILLLIMAGYIRLFLPYAPPTKWLSLVHVIDNITCFMTPVVSAAATIAIVLDRRSGQNKNSLENTIVLMVVFYQVFFFLVAYPHSDAAHLSWSLPTTLILLFYCLKRVRDFTVSNWPQPTMRTVGVAVAATLALFFPLMLFLVKLFWLMNFYYNWSPDLLHWSKRGFIKLDNERAGIYEFVNSANQIESVDRFIQTHTAKGDYLFEFPTVFFSFYSQRKNPSRCEYFYPGLYSNRQNEIISALERAKPRFAIIYDNPDAYIFSYSNPEIRSNFKELIAFIERSYTPEERIGYFTMLRRKDTDSDGKSL